MKRVLRSIWKGSVLGGLAGFVGGEVFVLVTAFFNLTGIYLFWVGLVVGQMLAVIPAAFIGVVFGGILGVLIKYVPDSSSLQKKELLTVFASFILHFILVLFVYVLYLMNPDSHSIGALLWGLYVRYGAFAILIYLAVSNWFAVNFHRKSVWMPAFLKDET